MNDQQDEKREKNLVEESILENHHKHVREMDDMPEHLRGKGPQENMDIGYDALEDL